MSWLTQALWWYLVVFLLGATFWPLTKRVFGRVFFDTGYPFAKTIGLLCLSYSVFLLSSFHILPFSRSLILLVAVIFLVVNGFLARGITLSARKVTMFILEEGLFLSGFIFWLFVRGQEPSIRGLEKFMDFGFMNSILRSTSMPPADIWYAGGTINYYYFGHFTGAILTKLTNLDSALTYNMILATLFALGITHVFSLGLNIFYFTFKNLRMAIFGGALATFLVNFAGNLHTIYTFTTGYNVDKPAPFWTMLSGFNPGGYWYPNATRFIPFTIHEFPIYSYVVADLHGHVFDIPFTLLTLALLFVLFVRLKTVKRAVQILPRQIILSVAVLGVMTGIHYMTNAFDGPIYVLLISLSLLALLGIGRPFLVAILTLIGSFVVTILPFSLNFKPFATSIGVNCAPQFLIKLSRLGPFLFEKGNCQISPIWMMSLLWGLFWLSFIFLVALLFKLKGEKSFSRYLQLNYTHLYFLMLTSFGIFLIAIPEGFYIKDIYPAHFRANTMFKLGYQAFTMMAFSAAYVFLLFKVHLRQYLSLTFLYFIIFAVTFALVAIYPYFAIKSYYGSLKKTPRLDGTAWATEQFPEYKEIIDYLNKNISGQPVILEAQGDSYTDFNMVSSYTGLPTVAGWWVHEWLWRGDSAVVGKRIPEVETIYQDPTSAKAKELISKYKIQYIIVGRHERQKYTKLDEPKMKPVFPLIFESSSGLGRIYDTTYRP